MKIGLPIISCSRGYNLSFALSVENNIMILILLTREILCKEILPLEMRNSDLRFSITIPLDHALDLPEAAISPDFRDVRLELQESITVGMSPCNRGR